MQAGILQAVQTTRRAFLIGAGATVGLAIGFAVWPREERLNLSAGPGETIINGWLKIGRDGQVVAVVPQAELGQGVLTALPQLLAAELGADWRTVAVEPAPPNPIYANRLLLGRAVDELPEAVRGVAGWALATASARLDLEATTGSSSVAAYEMPLRIAGATARTLLCKAAGERLGVDWRECDTADGFVVYQANRLTFAELAEAAATMAPEDEVALRPKLPPQRLPRLDGPGKVDGRAQFGADVRLPGMVYAAINAGPCGATRLVELDRNRLRRKVIGVVQTERWYAVAAESWWEAEQALAELSGRFERTALPDDDVDLRSRLDAALADGRERVRLDEGDADGRIAEGRAIEAGYSVPFEPHAALEPMAATALVRDGRAELWAPTQSARLAAWAVADALGLETAAVTVNPTFAGGSFGRKLEPDACVQAALLAAELKRPVQLVWSRAQDFRHDRFRPAAAALMRATLGPDRRIAAWSARIAAPSAGRAVSERIASGAMARALGAGGDRPLDGADPAYAIPARRLAHVEADLGVPVGLWRSGSHSYNAFFVESFVDELATAARTDPLAFRLRMLADRPRHAAVLRAAAARAGYGSGRLSAGAQGLAVHGCFGSVAAQVVDLEIDRDAGPIVRRVVCAVDCGRVVNPSIVEEQVEGSIVFALAAALGGGMHFAGGELAQTNFDRYRLPTLADTPEIEVVIVPSDAPPTGAGDVAVPPLAPAIANALHAATGVRQRSLPLPCRSGAPVMRPSP